MLSSVDSVDSSPLSTNSPGIIRSIGTGDTLRNQCSDIVGGTRKAGPPTKRLAGRDQCHPPSAEVGEKR